jgi:hypothetical protein
MACSSTVRAVNWISLESQVYVQQIALWSIYSFGELFKATEPEGRPYVSVESELMKRGPLKYAIQPAAVFGYCKNKTPFLLIYREIISIPKLNKIVGYKYMFSVVTEII